MGYYIYIYKYTACLLDVDCKDAWMHVWTVLAGHSGMFPRKESIYVAVRCFSIFVHLEVRVLCGRHGQLRRAMQELGGRKRHSALPAR